MKKIILFSVLLYIFGSFVNGLFAGGPAAPVIGGPAAPAPPAAPTGPPGAGGPTCGPPFPCTTIPIDGGIGILILAGAAYGTRKAIAFRKNSNKEKAE